MSDTQPVSYIVEITLSEQILVKLQQWIFLIGQTIKSMTSRSGKCKPQKFDTHSATRSTFWRGDGLKIMDFICGVHAKSRVVCSKLNFHSTVKQVNGEFGAKLVTGFQSNSGYPS